MIPIVKILNEGVVEKLTSLSDTVCDCVLDSDELNSKEQNTANPIQEMNTKPTLSIKGMVGKAILNVKDSTAEPIAADIAPTAFIFFQNIPRTKSTTIPGVKNPVNS